MTEIIFVFILTSGLGKQYIPGETLEECKQNRAVAMEQNKAYLEPWRYGKCHEMTRIQWMDWYARWRKP